MIDEKFLTAAVNIKQKYLRLVGDLDLYQNRAKETLAKLEMAASKIDKIQNDLKEIKNKSEDFSAMNEIAEIFNDIEEEGHRLEAFTTPINKEIEKLAIEEKELYKQICLKHPNLTEEQIVESVRKRLKKENLL